MNKVTNKQTNAIMKTNQNVFVTVFSYLNRYKHVLCTHTYIHTCTHTYVLVVLKHNYIIHGVWVSYNRNVIIKYIFMTHLIEIDIVYCLYIYIPASYFF